MRKVMYFASKKENAKRNALLKKAVQFCLASGMIAMPWVGSASEITRTDGGANINGTGVHNIYAGKDMGNGVGASTFSKFNVTSGDVANMHFRTSATSTTHFNTLLNFVDSRIDINGTVNAIRNGAVGGHLYFLSPAGMAVGANGAINAGSLTVLTPTSKWWEDVAKVSQIKDNGLSNNVISNIQNLSIPINSTGTIAVKGKINVTANMYLKAGTINITRDTSNDASTPYSAALLQSGVVDFTDVVKLSEDQLTAIGVNNLTATRTANSGDIIIAAEVSYNANPNMDKTNVAAEVNIKGGSQVKAYRKADVTSTALNNSNVTVYQQGTGDQKAYTYCVNGEQLTQKQFEERFGDASTSSSYYSNVHTKAIINILDDDASGGTHTTIEGREVNVVGKSQNVYTSDMTTKGLTGYFTEGITSILFNGIDFCIGEAVNEAKVKVGEGTVLHAIGIGSVDDNCALNVQALATTNITIGTWAGSLNLASALSQNTALCPSVSANYASSENTAEVELGGELKADLGGINVDAMATNTLNSSAGSGILGMGLLGNSDASFTFGIGVLEGFNTSSLVVKQTAKLQAYDSIELQSHATSNISNAVAMVSTEKSAATFGIGWLDYDNNATMTMDGRVISDMGSITLDAEAVYPIDAFKISASAGQGFFARFIGETLGTKHISNDIMSKLSTWMGTREGYNSSLTKTLADYMKLGISFGYMDNTNVANITIGPEAVIQAKHMTDNILDQDVTIKSLASINDLFTYVVGASTNAEEYSKEGAESNALVNGAIFLRTVTNDSNLLLNIDGNNVGNTNISGANITLDSNALMPYNRISNTFLKVWGDLIGTTIDPWSQVSEADAAILRKYYDVAMLKKKSIEDELFDENGKMKSEYADDQTNSDAVLKKMGEFEESDEYKNYINLLTTGDYVDENGNSQHVDIDTSSFGVKALLMDAKDAAIPQNYFSYSVASETGNRSLDKDQTNSKFGIGIAFGYSSVDNDARILMGRNTNIIGSGDVLINGRADYSDVIVNGGYLWSSTGSTGGNIDLATVSFLGNNSLVAVTEGASIIAGEDLSFKADAELSRIAVSKPLLMNKNESGILVVLDGNYYATDNNSIISIDDEALLRGDNSISLAGINDVQAVYFDGAVATGGKSAGSVVFSYVDLSRNNLVAVADNDGVGLLLQENQDKSNTYATDLADDDSEKSRLRKLLATKSGLEDAKAIAFYSNVLTKNGEITAGDWQSKVITEGKVGHFTLGFAISSNSDKHVEKKAHNRSLYTAIKDWIKSKRSSREQAHAPWEEMEWDNDLNQEMQELNGLGINNEEVNQDARQNVLNEDGDEQAVAQQNNSPKISFSGAGAIGVMKVDVVSASMMEGTTLNITKAAGKVQNLTNDDSLLVLMAGGTASAATGSAQNNSGGDKSIALSGAGSVIFGQSTLSAILSNTNINGAKEIYNSAVRDGVLGNAAAAVSVSRGTNNGLDLSSASGATVSLMKYDTKALLSGNSVNNSVEESAFPTNFCVTDITNTALDQDLQIMGGLDVAVAKGGNKAIGIGAVVTLAKVDNDVIALMDNGGLAGNSVYQKVGNVDVVAATDITQISAAIGAGIAASSGQNSAGVVFQGNVVYNQLDNDAKAEVNAITMTGESLNVAAYDTNLTKADLSSKNEENKNSLVVYGFDVDGKTYISHVQEQIEGENGTANTDLQDNGNLIVSGALEIAASTGSGIGASIGAGVIVGDIDNDFISIVKDSVISLGSGMMVSESNYVYPAQVFAESNTLQVGVAAGGNGSESGFAGGGSVVVNLFENDVIAKVDGSVFNTIGLRVDAQNKQKLVNVAGQIDIGKNVVGLDMVYNYMLNTTGAYFTNSSIENSTLVIDKKVYSESNLVLDANNDSDIYAIALGISVDTNADGFIAANGSIAVNRGQNDVYAVAENNTGNKKDLINLKAFTVHSKDDSYMAAATGGFTLSIGKTAFGGALTWNRLGSLTVTGGAVGKDESKEQVNKAIVSGYDIHMVDNGLLTINAEDKAKFNTVAIGLGIGTANTKFTLQGTNANAYINKQTTASIVGGNINKDSGDTSHFADVNVTADTNNEFNTVSTVVSVTGKGGAIGAALSQNTMKADTKASVAADTADSIYLTKDMLVKSTSTMDLTNAVVGVAASGIVSVGGSFVDNQIDNDTVAELGGTGGITNATAKGSVGVVSQSEEYFENYCGQANFTLGTVGGGVAIALNEIKGDTLAIAQNADVSTLASTGKAIQLHDSIDGKDGYYTGLVVGADALHDFYNAPFCGGLTLKFKGENAVLLSLGLDAAGCDDDISGTTKALMKGVSYNKNNSEDIPEGNNLTVLATDKMKSKAVVTNAGVSVLVADLGLDASLGVGVNIEKNSRIVEAEVDGDVANNGNAKRKVNADKINVKANSYAELASRNTAVSVTATTKALGISADAGVTYADLDVTTKATVKGIESYNNGIDILASHKDHIDLVGTSVAVCISGSPGISAAVSGHVESLNNKANTEACLDNSEIYHYEDNKATDSIKALSDAYVHTQDANVDISLGIKGITVGVLVADNDLKETVKTTVKDSVIGTSSKRAKNISVLSDNKVETHFNNQNVSVTAIGGVGVGVGLNTVDTSVSANVSNSTLYAGKDIDVEATESISLNGTMVSATVGAIAVGVSVLHNYVGTAVVDEDYSKWANNEEVTQEQMKQGEIDAKKIDGVTVDAIEKARNSIARVKTKYNSTSGAQVEAKAARSATLTNTGDQVNLANANLYAGNNITTLAKETVNTDTDLGSGSGGIFSVQVGVNRQRVTGNVGTQITGGIWEAGNDISISSLMDGQLKNNTVEVGIGGVPVCVTIGEVTKQVGGTGITLNTAKMTAADAISLVSKDDLAVLNKGTTVEVGGIVASAVDYTATDNATSTITLQYDTANKKGNDLEAKSITVSSLSVPNVVSDFDDVTVSLVTGAGVVMESTINNKAALTVEGNNRLWSDKLVLESKVYAEGDKCSAKTTAFSGAYSAESVLVNKARTYADIYVDTTVGELDLKTGTRWDDYGKQYTVGLCDVTISADDLTTMVNYMHGNAIGLTHSTGINYAQTDVKSHAYTIVAAGSNGLYAKNLNVYAHGVKTLDSEADGVGVAIALNASPDAAVVETKITGDTKTTLSGLFVADEAVSVEAKRENNLRYNVVSHQVSMALGYGSVRIDVDEASKEDTEVKIDHATIKTNGRTDIEAKTIVNVNKIEDKSDKDETIGVKGWSGGLGLDISCASFDNFWTINSAVNMTGGKIEGCGPINIGAYSSGNMNIFVEVGSWAIVYDGAFSTTRNQVTANDIITLSEGAEVRTTEVGSDVNIAASDSWEMEIRGVAENTLGVFGSTMPKVYYTLNRNNKVDVVSGTVFGVRDVNLYAGKETDGSDGDLNLYVTALAFNRTLVTGAKEPILENDINQTNEIKVQSAGRVQGVRHVQLYADNGREAITKTCKGYGSWSDDDYGSGYVSTTKGELNDVGIDRANQVLVDGSVTAGVANNLSVTIGNEVGDIVILNAADREGIAAATNEGITVYSDSDEDKAKYIHLYDVDNTGSQTEAEIAASVSKLTLDSFIIGSEHYKETLTKRYDEVQKLMSEYANDTDRTVYNGWKAEAERLKSLIDSLRIDLHADNIQYIVIPDLVASGGNVVVNTKNFSGSGSVTANGSPAITIKNYTNLTTKVNDITVDDPGGIIYYKDQALDPEKKNGNNLVTLQVQVKELNADHNKTVGTMNAAKGTSASVTIQGLYDGRDINYTIEDDEKPGTYINDKFAPRADIVINGNINSLQGSVNISSANNSITIEGKNVQDSVSVNGKVVSMVAVHGSITQGFTDGIVNVGGDVKSIYSQLYQKYVDDNMGLYTAGSKNRDDDLIITTIEDGQKAPEVVKDSDGNVTGNWIAGGQIFINASDININGVVQSGFDFYYTDTSKDTATITGKIDAIGTQWENNGSKELTDSAVRNAGDLYKVVDGGAYWNATKGCYEYKLDVFYNPYTKKLLTSDVDANGGRIYLTGRISSTGNGQLICLDGAYNIDVKNTLDYDLQVGKLIVNDTKGMISITDSLVTVTNADGTKSTLVTEITGDGVVTKNSKTDEVVTIDTHVTGSNRNYTYTPTSGLRYNWVEGYKTTSYVKYKKTEQKYWWGLTDFHDKGTEEIESWTSDAQQLEVVDTGSTSRPDGAYIGIDNSGDIGKGVVYKHTGENVKKGSPIIEGVDTKQSSWWFFKSPHIYQYTTYRVESGDIYSDFASVKADNLIKITLIGTAAEDSYVNVETTKNLYMSGKIGNTQLYEVKDGADQVIGHVEKGTVNLKSNNASVIQETGSIYGANVNLSAVNNLQYINITAGDTVNLQGLITGVGRGDITVDAAYGGAKGKVLVKDLGGSQAEYFSLTADGDISQLTNSNLVEAKRIDLLSGTGSIGGESGPYYTLRVKAGQNEDADGTDTLKASLNASAMGNVNIEQISGDLRVGKVRSENAGIVLMVPGGGIVDALPYDTEADKTSDEKLLSTWRELGLILNEDGSKSAGRIQNEEAQIDAKNAAKNYKDKVTEEYQQYVGLKTKKGNYEAYSEIVTQEYAQLAGIQTKVNDAQALTDAEQAIYDKYSGYDSAEAYLKWTAGSDTFNNSDQAAFNSYNSKYGAYASADAYLAADTHYQELVTNCAQMSDTYTGWNADQLLYAIQDSVINPQTGVKTSTKDVNIYGNDIVLYVKDSVGLNSDATRIVDLTTLGQTDKKGNLVHLDDLKALATADASTVKWDNEAKQATINSRLAIGIQQKKNETGVLTVFKYDSSDSKQNNIFLESRKVEGMDDNVQNYDLRLSALYTNNGNVSVTSWGSILNSSSGTTIPVIFADDLVLQAGAENMDAGSIGASDKPMTVQIRGNLTATATGNIDLSAVGDTDLRIASLSAGKVGDAYSTEAGNISITAQKDIYLIEQKSDIQGFIRSNTNGSISLISTEGSVGNEEHVVRILNAARDDVKNNFDTDEGAITISAAKDVFVEGVSTATPVKDNASDVYDQAPGGYMKLKALTVGGENISIMVNGELTYGGTEWNYPGANLVISVAEDFVAGKNITAFNLGISAGNDIQIASGVDINVERSIILAAGHVPTITYGPNVKIATEGGSIEQAVGTTEDVTSIKSTTLFAHATTGIDLEQHNEITNVILQNTQNDVAYTNYSDENAPMNIAVLSNKCDAEGFKLGDVDTYVHGAITIDNNALVSGGKSGDINVLYAIAGTGDVTIYNDTGAINNSYDIVAGVQGGAKADILLAPGSINNHGNISALTGTVVFMADDSLSNTIGSNTNGSYRIYGSKGVLIMANGDVYNQADIYSDTNNITIVGTAFYSNPEDASSGKVNNEGNIYVRDSGNVIFYSGQTVTNTGDIYSMGGGTVELKAEGDLDNHGDIFTYDKNNQNNSTAGVSLISKTGNVINTDDFVVEEDVLIKHSLDVPQGVVNAQGDILLSAMQGEIRNNKALVATGDITIKSLKSIYIEDAAFKNDVNLQTALGKTFVKGIQAGGKVTIESTNIYNSMEVTAGTGIELRATAEKDVSNGNVAIAETGVIVVHGNNGKFITESGDINITADGYTVQENYKNALLENPVDEKFSIRNLGNNDLITKDGNVHLEGVYSVENVGNIKASTTEEPSVSPKTRGKVYLKATKGTIYNYETSSSSELLFEHVARTAAEMAAGTYFTTKKTSNSDTAPHSIIADGDINWLAENIYNVAGQYSSSNLDMEITGASLYNTEKIITTGNVIVKATDQNSNVVFGSSITSETGSVTFNVGGNLTFTGGASIDAAKDIILEVGNNIISAIKLDAGENVDVHSRGGTITLNDGANSDTGLVRVYSQISTGTNGTDTVHVFGSVTAPEGSIDISSDTGDVSVDNLIAKKLAGVGTMKGDIKINGTISGKKVSIYTEDKDAKFTVNEMKATDELIVAGNYFNDSPYLDMSKFMGDNDGFKLHIFGVGGADPSNSRGNYILDYTNVGCNVEIGTVSVDTVKIITETPVKIDHLNVGNRADITCMGVTSSVYGRAHQYDVGSKVIYYAPGDPGAGINLHPVYFDEPLPKQPYIDQLMEDSTQFMNGAGAVQQGPLSAGNGPTVSSVHKNGGMSLNITTPLNQRGTGILLKNFYGQKTFAQRFSAENLEQHLNSEKAQDFYNGYFNMGVEFFETYNLLDIPSANLNQGQGQRTSNVIQLETMFEDGGVVVEGTTTDKDGKKVKKSVEYEF